MGGGKKARKAAEKAAREAKRERDAEKKRIANEKAEQARIDKAKQEEIAARGSRGLVATILNDDEDEVLGA